MRVEIANHLKVLLLKVMVSLKRGCFERVDENELDSRKAETYMIQRIIKERKKFWVIMAYIIVTAFIYGLSLNDFSSIENWVAMASFSVGIGINLFITLLTFIVIEEKIEICSKWSKRGLRLVSLFLISLAIGGVMDSSYFWIHYFILWLAFGEKRKNILLS